MALDVLPMLNSKGQMPDAGDCKRTHRVAVLFVCFANKCRSPAAEAILKEMISGQLPPLNIRVESCGIGAWSVGEPPDERMRAAAEKRGISLSGKAQQFNTTMYDSFDFILGVDDEVVSLLTQHALRADQKAKIHLMSAYSADYHNQKIPDPYRDEEGFDKVLDILTSCCEGLLNHLKNPFGECSF